jgi:hypothetical protein
LTWKHAIPFLPDWCLLANYKTDSFDSNSLAKTLNDGVMAISVYIMSWTFFKIPDLAIAMARTLSGFSGESMEGPGMKQLRSGAKIAAAAIKKK